MTNLNIKINIDEPSVLKLLNSLSQEQRDCLSADDIMWKVGETYSQNNETYMPIYAIGIKGKITLQNDNLTLLNLLSNEQENEQCSELKEMLSVPTGIP